jgi:CHAD domain-containing protein
MSYRIDASLPLTSEVRRIAAEELEGALGHLSAAHEEPDEALHECRKRLKALRALLRLIRSGDKAFFRAENARYRDVFARLAGPREAAALIETVDRLAKAFPDEAASGELSTVRDRLVARRDGILSNGADLAIEEAAAACRAGLRQIEKLALPDQPEGAADILADGVRRTMRRAGKALEKARTRGHPEDFHELRKALKAHSKHLLLLKKLWPSPAKARRKAVDELAERLGDLHDIFVLRALLKDKGQPLGGPSETRLLARLSKRSERELEKTCLDAAAGLFQDSPKRSVRKVARKIQHDFAELQPATAP